MTCASTGRKGLGTAYKGKLVAENACPWEQLTAVVERFLAVKGVLWTDRGLTTADGALEVCYEIAGF
jgi:hypothetical protein